MDQIGDDTRPEPPESWVEALERARADVAAGRTGLWSEIRARLIAEIAESDAAKARHRA